MLFVSGWTGVVGEREMLLVSGWTGLVGEINVISFRRDGGSGGEKCY